VQNLPLERPLIFFDLETTGVDPRSDRIVEIGLIRLSPDGSREVRTRRINPECPIPAGASAVHGIHDADVKDEPTFRQIARGLLEWLEGADLAGFNVRRFDLPLLDREFRDCGLDLGASARKVVDAMTIFHRKERRDLTAAVKFYLDREFEDAHSAEADIQATMDILDAQLGRYDDLPRSVDELDVWTHPVRDAVDSAGKFVRRNDEVVFAFGKHQGRPLKDVAEKERGYLEWIVGTDFPDDAKTLVRQALSGEL
jgi:DNA polymerase-3 subunit epsilon